MKTPDPTPPRTTVAIVDGPVPPSERAHRSAVCSDTPTPHSAQQTPPASCAAECCNNTGSHTAERCAHPGHAGAMLVFEGFVRELEPREGDLSAQVQALDYQTYEPMAQNQIIRIGDALIAAHGLLGLEVIHSRGRVRVGECSIRVTIRSRHRKEALAAMDAFLDQLKKDVPIWKEPVWR